MVADETCLNIGCVIVVLFLHLLEPTPPPPPFLFLLASMLSALLCRQPVSVTHVGRAPVLRMLGHTM